MRPRVGCTRMCGRVQPDRAFTCTAPACSGCESLAPRWGALCRRLDSPAMLIRELTKRHRAAICQIAGKLGRIPKHRLQQSTDLGENLTTRWALTLAGLAAANTAAPVTSLLGHATVRLVAARVLGKGRIEGQGIVQRGDPDPACLGNPRPTREGGPLQVVRVLGFELCVHIVQMAPCTSYGHTRTAKSFHDEEAARPHPRANPGAAGYPLRMPQRAPQSPAPLEPLAPFKALSSPDPLSTDPHA